MLDKLKDAKFVVGVKQTKKAVKSGEAVTVFIARDAQQRVIQPIIDLCNEKGIEAVYAESMDELGRSCQIEVSAATAAIVK